jgi:hypothetical protein
VGRKQKRKTRKRTQGESRREGEARASKALRRKLSLRGVEVTGPPPGAPKASDSLVKVVEPLVERIAAETGMNKERMEAILRLGLIAWNAGSLGYTSVRPLLEEHGGEKLTSHEDREFMVTAVLQPLLDRRRKLFGDDRRMLADFVVLGSATGDFRISVAWADPEPVAAATK